MKMLPGATAWGQVSRGESHNTYSGLNVPNVDTTIGTLDTGLLCVAGDLVFIEVHMDSTKGVTGGDSQFSVTHSVLGGSATFQFGDTGARALWSKQLLANEVWRVTCCIVGRITGAGTARFAIHALSAGSNSDFNVEISAYPVRGR